MAYAKRKRSFKKKPWYRKKYDTISLAKKALQGVWYLKGLVNSEMLHNQGLGSTTTPITGTMTLLNGMAQNDTSSGRTGNSILMRNVHLRLGFIQNAAATTTTYRVILLWDTQQTSDTNPAVTDVLESASPYSPLATANAGRFKVLKNWFFTTDDTKSQTKLIECYKQFRIHTRYNGTANTDIQKGGIYMLALTSDAADPAAFAYNYKLGYHDN